jgi:hypothetical protein
MMIESRSIGWLHPGSLVKEKKYISVIHSIFLYGIRETKAD